MVITSVVTVVAEQTNNGITGISFLLFFCSFSFSFTFPFTFCSHVVALIVVTLLVVLSIIFIIAGFVFWRWRRHNKSLPAQGIIDNYLKTNELQGVETHEQVGSGNFG